MPTARSDQPRVLATGSGPVLEPAFYAYAVPEPPGLKTAAIQPEGALYTPAQRVHPSVRGRPYGRVGWRLPSRHSSSAHTRRPPHWAVGIARRSNARRFSRRGNAFATLIHSRVSACYRLSDGDSRGDQLIRRGSCGVPFLVSPHRERSRMLFDLLADDAYYSQPIALRHPIVFYEGHLARVQLQHGGEEGPAGPVSTSGWSNCLPAASIQATPMRHVSAREAWPSREMVRGFAEEADRRVLDVLGREDLDHPGHPLLDRSEAVFAILEHEAMHQETLLYMWHRLPFEQKQKPAGYVARVDGLPPPREWVAVPGGRATLGVDRASVPFVGQRAAGARHRGAAFAIERHDVTNGVFLEFVEAGGYADSRWWRPRRLGLIQQDRITHPLFWERHTVAGGGAACSSLIPLPASWPVYVSFAEASAFCRWRGVRLPTEGEFQRAAYGTPDGSERRYPWQRDPTADRGVFDFTSWDPGAGRQSSARRQRLGSGGSRRQRLGVDEHAIRTVSGFAPLASYPEYRADFFDEEHFVMKGASPQPRASCCVRARNWFRARYPYMYATFREAKDA